MKTALVFGSSRDGYSIGQVADRAMTVEDLRELLEDYEDDDLIIISHDNGYTYGSLWFEDEVTDFEEGE